MADVNQNKEEKKWYEEGKARVKHTEKDEIIKDYEETINRFDKEENFIQLKKDNILRIGIKDSNGNDTGEHLEFDMEDIELPLKLNQCDIEHKKNIEYVKMQFAIIDKKQDVKGKYIISKNEEDKLKVLKEFYRREMNALDLFLGKDGTKKLLNGRNPYYTMYDDIGEVIAPILPKLKLKSEDIKNKIVNKYSKLQKEDNVLK